ncbi:MAG: tetratricopeptide repeat protein [Deltaproteobacteria bacterium]|nr:tetratricopeptide repeat protein [Deltaproteobacteria bacterium]
MACGARVSGGAAPSPAGLVVLIAFLAVGLALWGLLAAPGPGPGRIPLPPKDAGGTAGATAAQGSLPKDHPSLEIPADVKKFIGELEQKAAAQPKDLETWKNAAQVEYRAGQVDRQYLDKAEASFRHVLELDADNLDALRALGNLNFDRERYAQAVEFYSRYLALKPDDLNVRTDLGTMHLYGGDADKAIAEYDRAIARDSTFYQAHFNRGIALAQKGDGPQALASLTRARELAPDDATRKQIEAMIDHTQRASAAPAAGAPVAPKGFQGLVEDGLRAHPIVGPKIVALEWTSAVAGRARLRDFPLQAMPETVRQKFLERVENQLGEAKRRSAAPGRAELQLVDDATGQVMATVSAE